MQPLRIMAELASSFAAFHPVALDAVLAAMLAARDQYPPPSVVTRVPPLTDLPLLVHPLGFAHASQAHCTVGSYETVRWTKKSPPVLEASILTSAKVIPLAGRWKSYYMPLRLTLPAGMLLTWWAVGDLAEVARLLAGCFGVGAKRNCGHGWVATWTVELWPEDWSILRPADEYAGALVPARNLPAELAPRGWSHWQTGWTSYPYWRAGAAPLVAVPPPAEVCRGGGW
jgi:hypothetical protein